MTQKIRKDAKSDARKGNRLKLKKQTLKDLALGGRGPKGGGCTHTSEDLTVRVRRF